LRLGSLVVARIRLMRKPAIIELSIFGYLVFVWLMLYTPAQPNFQSVVGFDCAAYWLADIFHPYLMPLGTFGSFTYSPAFALASAPGHLLPFWLYFIVWDSFLIVLLVWMTRRWTLIWLVFLPVPLELFHGNVHILLAAVCVLGFEYPAVWSIGILTKVTPGISLLWFVVRREWRSLAWALGATAVITAVSFAIAPSAWFEWVKFLTNSNASGPQVNVGFEAITPPLWLRLVGAAGLIVWGARTDRRWVVPVATAVSMPVLWIITPAILVAIPRLRTRNLPESPDLVHASGALDSSAAVPSS
jgi:hypothetical protein